MANNYGGYNPPRFGPDWSQGSPLTTQYGTAGGGNPLAWLMSPWLTAGTLGLGVLGDLGQALGLWGGGPDLPEFGRGYLSRARQLGMPELRTAQSVSARDLMGANVATGGLFDAMGMRRSGPLIAAQTANVANAAQRNQQLMAQWQQQINNLAMQLYQADMQRIMAEYEAGRGGGIGGFLGGLGQIGAGLLPWQFMSAMA